MTEKKHKSGFVSIIGKPNAGKSTLLNALLDEKLSIITHKAQTTRHRILGFDNGENYQIIYSDTPGVIKPKYKLHHKMMDSVGTALEDADVLVLLIAVDERFPEEELLQLATKVKVPKILAVNKIDLAEPDRIEARIKDLQSKVDFVDTIQTCALNKEGVDKLKDLILKHLPEGPAYYDKEALSDRPERFFISEIIREKLFLNLEQELPYSTEVTVVDFKEEEKITRIHAEIHVERKSQKGMVIGKGASMLKKIGTESRKDIEAFLQKKVFLDLYVRVTDNWKDNQLYLRNFGYQ